MVRAHPTNREPERADARIHHLPARTEAGSQARLMAIGGMMAGCANCSHPRIPAHRQRQRRHSDGLDSGRILPYRGAVQGKAASGLNYYHVRVETPTL